MSTRPSDDFRDAGHTLTGGGSDVAWTEPAKPNQAFPKAGTDRPHSAMAQGSNLGAAAIRRTDALSVCAMAPYVRR